jgi:arsenite methyltransferase
MTVELTVDKAARQRYAEGARERQESLCCPVSYTPRYLEVIPREVCSRRQISVSPTSRHQPV